MATGSFALTRKGYTSSALDIWVDWSYSQNVANNTSTVYAAVKAKRSNSGYTTEDSPYVSINIDGSVNTKPNTYVAITNTEVTLHSYERTVEHNSDGTKTITISVDVDCVAPAYIAAYGSKSITLTTIPRASTPSLSVQTLTALDTLTINTNRKSTAFTHKAYAQFPSGDYTLIADNVTDSCEWNTSTLPEGSDILNWFANGSTYSCTIKLETYNGQTKIGEKTTDLTINMPQNEDTLPKIENISVVNISIVEVSHNCFVQTKDKAEITLSALATYGALIQNITAICDGVSYEMTYNQGLYECQTGTLRTSGNKDITITATDTRGFVSSATTNIDVIPYYPPKIKPAENRSEIKVYRCDSNGDYKEDGTQIRIGVSRDYAPVKQGDENINQCVLTWKYKNTMTSEYIDGGNLLTAQDDSDSYWGVVGEEGFFQTTFGYDILLYCKDDFSDAVICNFKIPTEATTLHLKEGGYGIGIGKRCEKPSGTKAVEIDKDWDVYFGDTKLNNYIIHRDIRENPSSNRIVELTMWSDGSYEFFGLSSEDEEFDLSFPEEYEPYIKEEYSVTQNNPTRTIPIVRGRFRKKTQNSQEE